MKKVFSKIVMAVLGLIFLGGCMNRPTQVQMNEELKKPEVVKVIEEAIRNADKDAFTETGIIKSYEIDYSKTYHNPMGGIVVTIYVNDDKILNFNFIINKYDGIYTVGGTTNSIELEELLRR